jgi:hypothetical protein
MSNLQPAAPNPKCTPCLAFLLVGLVVLVVAFGWVVMVVQKVFGGAGMEHCCTIEGVPFNYLAVFVFLCGLAVALMLALSLQVRDWLLRRDFERKYGVKVPASTGEPASFSGADYGPSLHGVDYHDGE